MRRALALVMLAVCPACTSGLSGDFTEEDLALLRTMELDPVRAPPTDVSNDLLRGLSSPSQTAYARFGQKLFFEPGLSVPRPDGTQVSCADCHLPADWFSDPREERHVSNGVGWTRRNSPSLVNVGYYLSFGWDGRADALWAQGKHAYESGATMKGDRTRLARFLAQNYRDDFQQTFGTSLPTELDDPNNPRFADVRPGSSEDQILESIFLVVLKSWSAYLLHLTSGDAPFDRFARGEAEALDPAQRRGLRLFIGKAGCVSCHRGPNFTDNGFHSVGIEQTGAHVPLEDLGRYDGIAALLKLPTNYRVAPAPTALESDKGKFRTKSLRHVAKTAPYFHAGQLKTLADVVWFYNQGGHHEGSGPSSPLLVPLGLSEGEQADLVAFLGALTGAPVSAAWACDNRVGRPPGATPRCGTP